MKAGRSVPLWAFSFVFGTSLGSIWPPPLWHGHEMLFGFIASAIAGFLLTAVPSWTGQKGVSGHPLSVLTGVAPRPQVQAHRRAPRS